MKERIDLSRGGYTGRILRIDLTRGTFDEERMDPSILRRFIGGVGLGIKLLYGGAARGVDPYDAENRLMFLTGPLTGTTVPGSGSFEVISKSPLTGFVGSAQANGRFGARLKQAGFDGLVFSGKSEKPVYLHIRNGIPSLREASLLWGKTTYEVERVLSEVHAAPGNPISIASIGPSGERGVRFAAIVSDFGHVAATGGLGAVMGSKNLKALVVQGNFEVPIPEKERTRVRKLTREWTKKALEGSGGAYAKWGTQVLFTSYHMLGWLPIKNLTTNVFPEADQFEVTRLREDLFKKVRRTPCHACTFNHCRSIEIAKSPFQGVVVDDPEYEDLAGWGPNLGITDPAAAAFLNYRNDSLGMDLKECTFTISLVMECYEKGLLTRKDMDGLDLSWGNAEAVLQLMEKISRREGFGDLLADGVKRAAERIGGEAALFAVYCKRGMAPHVHDPRTRWGTIFAQAVSDTGSIDGIDFTTRTYPDLGIVEPPSEPDERVAFAQARSGPYRHLEDSLMNCFFFDRGPGMIQIMAEVLSAVTGFGYSKEELLRAGDRITNLLRVYNVREGLMSEDDSLSPRLLSAPQDGPQKGKSFAESFPRVLQAYYREKGWDENTGKPLPTTLKSLELEEVIRDIW